MPTNQLNKAEMKRVAFSTDLFVLSFPPLVCRHGRGVTHSVRIQVRMKVLSCLRHTKHTMSKTSDMFRLEDFVLQFLFSDDRKMFKCSYMILDQVWDQVRAKFPPI